MAREQQLMILHVRNASLGLVTSSWDTLGITLEHIMPASQQAESSGALTMLWQNPTKKKKKGEKKKGGDRRGKGKD